MIITAHIENEQNSFGGIDQFIIIDSISESQSELSEHFLFEKNIKNSAKNSSCAIL